MTLLCIGGPANGKRIDTTADMVHMATNNVQYVRKRLTIEDCYVEILVPKGQSDRTTLNWLIAGFENAEHHTRWKP